MFKRIRAYLKNYLFSKRAYRFFIRDWFPLKDLQNSHKLLSTMRFSQNLQPEQKSAPSAKRILVIAPHPDDETIGPGGTLLKAIRQGSKVLTFYLSSNSALKEEANYIAKQYGFQTDFLNYSPKSIPINTSVLSEKILTFTPDIIFLPFLLDDHDDHRRASELLLETFKSYDISHDIQIWAYQVYSTVIPNVVVDISDVAIDKKSMISCWETQNNTRNWPHYALGLNAFNQRFLPNTPQEKYAETFFVLPIKAYIDLCQIYFENPSNCYYTESYKKRK